jgi:L-lactate dehydrogenase complex protein LldG
MAWHMDGRGLRLSTPLQIFKERFESNNGRVHMVRGLDDIPQTLASIVDGLKAERAVVRVPKPLQKIVSDVLRKLGIEILHGDSIDEISMSDAGITMADFGIADTGTIVEITGRDLDRLVSALPRIHISFLNMHDILPSVEGLAELIRKALHPPESRKYITLISGPSRTSDIELRSVLGVHGPHQVHVIVLEAV